mgnify:CR=1 FL=1
MSEEEHQLYPNDVEAMFSQGVIAKHSEELPGQQRSRHCHAAGFVAPAARHSDARRGPGRGEFDPEAQPVYFAAGNAILD